MLNRALLKAHYDIEFWDIPAKYLCPPNSGRADYVHHLADLLAESNNQEIPLGRQIKALDIVRAQAWFTLLWARANTAGTSLGLI